MNENTDATVEWSKNWAFKAQWCMELKPLSELIRTPNDNSSIRGSTVHQHSTRFRINLHPGRNGDWANLRVNAETLPWVCP